MQDGSRGTWTTDVNSLIRLFQRTLQVLVPIAEEAHIPWRGQEAYDDWDTIAETLYVQIVERSIRWALPDEIQDAFKLAKYGTLPLEREVSLLQVLGSPNSELGIFHSLGTVHRPFDSVRLLPSDATRQLSDYPLTKQLLADVDIRLLLRRPSGSVETMTSLNVVL